MAHDEASLLARFLGVPTIGALPERFRRGEDITSRLLITVDDRNLDNVQAVAPLLARRAFPACCFLSTEFIGSNR